VRWPAAVCSAVLLTVAAAAAPTEHPAEIGVRQSLPGPALDATLANRVDPVIDSLWTRFDQQRALAHVNYISQFWRLGGNPGYDATLDRVHQRLIASGFNAVASRADRDRVQSSTWFESYQNPAKSWTYSVGTVALARPGQPDEIVLSRAQQQIALCINSFSTPPSGVVVPLVDVGTGAESDYTGKNVRGAVVLGDAPAGTLWRVAILGHGAAGIISTELSPVVSPDPPGTPPRPRDQWEVLEWGSIPYDEAHPGFGFKASPRAAARLRRALLNGGGRASVHVTVTSAFADNPVRTLVAEIPGRTAPGERVIVTAHVQEPGANDNASGVATLVELARALRLSIANGQIAAPNRTITFLWLEEISGSRQWLKDHADEAKNVRDMFSLDMVGEDIAKTGGTFLIERSPDPGAVWERPWDPHTDWGKGDVRPEQLSGDLINDLHLALCLRVARKSNWIVRTNPYEGGSDHTVFGQAGVPAVLDWHFTDRYYHTNLDTPDKTSPGEMRNVASAVGASAWLLASADETAALSVATLVQRAGQARLSIEIREGARLAESERDPRIARLRQAEIVATWRKWYVEAVRSAQRLIPGGATPAFSRRLDQLAEVLERSR
jgi:aminopeptidase YwaD